MLLGFNVFDNRTDPSGLLDDDPDGEWPKFAMYGRTIEKSKPLICERDQKIRELKAKFGSLFQSKEDFLKFFAGVRRGFYEDGLKGDIEFVGLCVEACLRYSNPVNLFNDIWRGAEKVQSAWESAQDAAEAVAPFIVAYETSNGDFDKFFDSLTPEQQELILSLAPLLLEIEIGLIELLGEAADPELIGRIYGMILYELLVDAAIAGAVVATAGTGSGGAGAAYGVRSINFAKKLENIGPFGKHAAKLVDRLKPQIEQTLKLISEGGGGRKKFKDCRGDIRSPKQTVGSGNGGSLKNKMGEPDEAARRARTAPVHGRPDVPETKVDAPTRGADADELVLPQSVGAQSKISVTSRIKESNYAVRLAEDLSTQAQSDVDSLIAKFLAGNPNPGIGTRALGNGFYELRGPHGGRVIVKQISSCTYDIVGKFQGHALGDTGNSAIINRLMNDYK